MVDNEGAGETQRVLITGGSGFIGTNLVGAYLEQGHPVLNIDVAPPRDPAHKPSWERVDILDRGALEKAFTTFRPSLMFHLAARADLTERKLSGYAANMQGVSNVIAAVVAAGSVRRSFFASSRLVCKLGYSPKHDRDYRPSTLYGVSKMHGEEIVRQASDDLGTWTILRPTGIWGPWFGVPYYDFFRAVRRGVYVHPGRLKVRKAYGYVENTVYQLQRLASVSADAVHAHTFWIADYPPVLVRHWARLIQEELAAPPIRSAPVSLLKGFGVLGDAIDRVLPGRAPLTSFRVNNMVSDMLYDTGPLEALVGELPYSLGQGVRRTVAWLRHEGGNSGPWLSRSTAG